MIKFVSQQPIAARASSSIAIGAAAVSSTAAKLSSVPQHKQTALYSVFSLSTSVTPYNPTATPLNNFVQRSQAAAQPALSLSRKATAITNFLFGDDAIPTFLQQYGSFFQKALLVTGGAAAATGLYHFFQQHKTSREKVKLAVFHVIRLLEHNPDYHALLQTPQQLIRVMDAEVTEMLQRHLTPDEGQKVMRELKRKIWLKELSAPQPQPKRQRKSEDNAQQDVEIDAQLESSSPQASEYSSSDSSSEASNTEDLVQEQLQADQRPEEDQDISMMDAGSLPASSSPSQGPSPVAPYSSTTNGYGFTYSPDSIATSSSSPPVSSPTPTYDQTKAASPPSSSSSTAPVPQVSKNISWIDREIAKAFDPNSPGTKPYVRRSPAVKPPNPFPPNPPNFIAVATGYTATGTELSPIAEGDSVTTLDESSTQYRVNETRDFYKALTAAREARQKARAPSVRPVSSSPAVTKQSPVEKPAATPVKRGRGRGRARQTPKARSRESAESNGSTSRRSTRKTRYSGTFQK